MRQTVAWLLVSLFAIPADARPGSIREQTGKIKTGTKIEVALNSGEVLKGRMGVIMATGFVVEPANGSKRARAADGRPG